MKVIYMAHPVGSDVADNIARAKRWYRYLLQNYEVSIVADWIISCEVLNDDAPEDRARGLAADFAVIKRVDELWLCGPHISPGMQAEAEVAYAAGITVRILLLGTEPPKTRSDIESYPLWRPSLVYNEQS